MTRPRRRLSYDRRIVVLALASALPGAIIALVFLWTGDYTPKIQWTLSVLILAFVFGFALALRERVVVPLQTVSNLLAALGEGDFSIRARGARSGDALGDVMIEVNALVDTLRTQRLGAVEATTLLRKVMEEIEVAVYTFDLDARLQFVNRAGAHLLRQPVERLLGHTANDLGLADCLAADAPRIMPATFPGGSGRWEIKRSQFRQEGRPHELLVISDVSQPLREEERQAWQRLIRVMGHELNNSLAPIKSITGSLAALLARDPRAPDWREDMTRGLDVIGSRVDSLNRFMSAYARLARLPQPTFAPIDVPALVRRVIGLDGLQRIQLDAGPALAIRADADQIEQLLINLVRNGTEAARETGGGVRVGWTRLEGLPDALELWVDDEGPGLADTGNLFVPFFTTKPGGSGIGLVLSRQIAEAHGGTLTLENRSGGQGCRATLRLPIRGA